MVIENITIKQNEACFIGTLESIMTDAKLKKNEYDSLLKEFYENTKGNVTSIYPNQIESYLDKYFSNFKIYNMKRIEDILPYQLMEFTILFWEGKNGIDENGEPKIDYLHVTRFIEANNNFILLVEPTGGVLRNFEFQELNYYSPNGFNLVTFNRK